MCYMWPINIFHMYFVEEVILADDDNENEYDGMNLFLWLFFFTVFVNARQGFVKRILLH